MVKICIQNLDLILGEECNINCMHCLRGKKTKKVMSDAVIEETFNQISDVCNLNICGGEPTLAIDRIKKTIKTIVEKRTIVKNITLTINGTIYSEELINLAKYFVKYSRRRGRKKNTVKIFISLDKYHFYEMQRLNLFDEFCNNIKKYQKSKFFAGYRRLVYDLYNEGNARNLNVPKEDYIPHLPVITYAGHNYEENRENGACNIGPLVTISTDGFLTEDSVSFENQIKNYNYGSIFNGRIDELLIENGAIVVSPREFDRENQKVLTNILENKK